MRNDVATALLVVVGATGILIVKGPAAPAQAPVPAGGAVSGDDAPAPEPPSPKLRGWAQQMVRAGTRLVYFHETAPTPWDVSPGQVAITYTKLPWKPLYEESMDRLLRRDGDAPEVQRWRLGRDLWTTLDARLPISIGGVRIESGYYYLVLELDQTTDEDRVRLAVVDPDAMTAGSLDAWHVDKKELPVLVRAPLDLARAKEDRDAKELDIKLAVDGDDPARGTLTIAFGPYLLSAAVVIDVT